MDFIEELEWRGMIHDVAPGTRERLNQGMTSAYIGFDPTASSLQVGNLAAIMLLVQFQRCGHKPIVVVGGGTGMVGDPSGRNAERVLMSMEEIAFNQECQAKQLKRFLDFDSGANNAIAVNNYDWLGKIGFLEFLRDVGKYLTISYMIAKDSVQQRLEGGISFTEFSYQLLQAYDFWWLFTNKQCELQMGGADQWGNITAGIELIRKKSGGTAYGVTCPLITNANGAKFGKSAAGERIWLDPAMTSSYKFYQFWYNSSDEDAARYIKTFTILPRQEIVDLILEHGKAPHLRLLQKRLAQDITLRVHSEEGYQSALEASAILFGEGTTETLMKIKPADFLEIFEGVPHIEISRALLEGEGIDIVSLLSEKSSVFPSKSEIRRMIQNNGVSLNKVRVQDAAMRVTSQNLINGRYLLVQKGRKNYYLLMVV